MTGQSRKMSLLESLANVAIGYGIAITAQVIIFPWFGIHLPMVQHLLMGGFFTVVSIVRSYCLRRAFNWIHVRRFNRWRYSQEIGLMEFSRKASADDFYCDSKNSIEIEKDIE